MNSKVISAVIISVALVFVLGVAILGSDNITGAAVACTDSDQGSYVNVKGTTSDSKGSYVDRCEGASLIEYYCSGKIAKSKTITCSAKTTCSDGACVNNILLGTGPTYYCCTGSLKKTGSKITTDINCEKKGYWDTNRCSGQNCIDWCKKQGYSGGMIVGMGCKCGSATASTCTDTDGGNNPTVMGTCTDSSGAHADICTSDDKAYEAQYDIYWTNHVVEYYCEAGSCKSAPARCGEVCLEGTCY